MTTPIYFNPEKRHDFMFLFDVTDGNPNGDPDAGNLPRVDPETMQGLVTDVAVKRKIRDWVDVTRGDQERFKIYIQDKGIALNERHEQAHQTLLSDTNNSYRIQFAETDTAGSKKQRGKREASAPEKEQEGEVKGTNQATKRALEQARRDWMCQNFYDVRTFGAVMSTGDYSAGQVRGPIQLTFSRSIDPIIPLDLAITRVAITKKGEDKKTEMGRKSVVPYALYKGHGFFTPHFARQTGFSQEDLELFWRALQSAWEIDHSASRGLLALRGLCIFSHESPLGNAPAHKLFERLTIHSNVQIPRTFADYRVTLNEETLPDGVTLTYLVDFSA